MSDDKQKMPALRTSKARLSYPHLDKPAPDEQGVMWYSACLIFDPDAQKTAEFQAIKEAVGKVAQEDIKKNYGGETPEGYRNPLRKAESKMKKGEFPSGMGAGFIFINVKTKTKPGVVSSKKGPDGKPLPIDEANIGDELYPGCFVRATLSYPFAYEKKGNKGVSLFLNNMQKLGEGERLGGRSSAEDDFEALDDGPTEGGDGNAVWD